MTLGLVTSVTLTAERFELGPHLSAFLPGFPTAVPALIDTGAAMSLVDVDLAQEWYPTTSEPRTIGGLGQGEEHPTFDIEVYIPHLDRYVPTPISGGPLIRSRMPFFFIIGRDVLTNYILTIDGPNRTITFHQR